MLLSSSSRSTFWEFSALSSLMYWSSSFSIERIFSSSFASSPPRSANMFPGGAVSFSDIFLLELCREMQPLSWEEYSAETRVCVACVCVWMFMCVCVKVHGTRMHKQCKSETHVCVDVYVCVLRYMVQECIRE